MIDGIDTNPNPIDIDTPRAREFVNIVNNFPGVQEDWYRKKLMYFAHHLDAHMEVEEIDDIIRMKTEELAAYAMKYPDEYERISTRMDRHRVTMLLAYACLRGDDTGMTHSKADKSLLECAAYQGIIAIDAISIADAVDSVLSVEQYSKEVGGLNDAIFSRRLMDMIRAQATNFKVVQNIIIDNYKKFLSARRNT